MQRRKINEFYFIFLNFADEPDIKGVCLSLILLKALIRWWYFNLMSILCDISCFVK